MYKRLLFSLLFIVGVCLASIGQTWYAPGQQAYEVRVPQEGLYAVTGGRVGNMSGLIGLPVNSLKLFHNGQEVAIRIADADRSGTWTANDTLWFFGQVNHGEAETPYYQFANYQNKYAPLYSQAGLYYLMSSGGNGLRMEVTAAATASSPVVTDWTAELTLAPRKEYSYGNGAYQYSKFHQSHIGQGEGWCSAASNADANFSIANPYAVRAGQAKIVAWINGRNALPQRGILKMGTTQVLSTDFANYERKIDSGSISTAGIGSTIPLTLSPGLANDYISLMLARIVLPVQPVAVDQPAMLKSVAPNRGNIKLPLSVGTGLFLQVNDPRRPKVLSLTSSQYVAESDSANGGLSSVWLQRKAFEVKDSLVEAKVLNVSDLPLGGGFLIITSHKLADTARQYADYRSSVLGGGHSVRMVFVEDMYAQYSYGYPTSQAIRAYLSDNMGGTKPSAVFLLGKALMHTTLLADSILKENHVPTWGVPASDNYLTITDTGGFHNKVPISRLAAKNGREILIYLNKVKAQDSNTDRLWRKNTYHLSGGRTAGEIDQFREYIMAYSETVRAPLIGGTPYEYSKQSASVIEAVNIRDKINAGVSILNLFGHSASTTTDIDIGMASDEGQGYQNDGRYPLVIVNGCFAGNIYERGGFSLNENWMLTPGKGAIAFSGSMDEGLPPLLDRHTTLVYKHQFSDTASSSKPIGEIYQMAHREYVGPYSNVFDSIMVEQIILHGDPLITLFPYSKPDYSFEGAASKIVAQDVSGLTKSFALRLTVQNPGIYHPGDSLGVVGRIVSGGIPFYGDPIKLPALRRDTVINYQVSGAFELDNTSVIECNVDYLNQVEEQSEDNNTLTISLGRFENGVSFIYPSRDAIVASREVNLVYRNLQPAASSAIAIEVDTSRHFTSGLRQRLAGGSLVVNQTSLTLPNLSDSTVFYLRYRIETNNQVGEWQSYAFTLIRGEQGWGQSTGFQYQDNQIEGYNVDSAKIHKPWSFTEKQITVRMYTPGNDIYATYRNSGIDINGIPYFYGTQNSCLGYANSLLTLRLNRNSLEPYVDRWEQPFEEFWRYSCGRVPTALNYYKANDLLVASGSLSGFNIQQMHPGDYYFAMSHGYIDWAHVGFWYIGSATYVGAHADSIKKALPGSPMITFGIRTTNASPNAGYTVLASKFDTINDLRTKLDTTFIIRKYPGAGKVESPFIGPAIDFKKLTINSTPNGSPDSSLLTVRGYGTFSDTGSVVYRGVPHGLSLSGIAQRFRYVKLTYESPNLEDSSTYLNAWRVTYVPYPEGVAIAASATSPVNAGDTVVVKAKYNHTISNVGDRLAATLYVRSLAGVLLDTIAGIAVKTIGIDTSFVTFKWKSQLSSPDTVGFEVLFNAHFVPERNYTNNSAFTQVELRKDTTHYSGYFEIDGMVAENGIQVNSSPVITYRLNRDFTGKTIALSFGGNCDSCNQSQVTDFTVVGNEVRFAPTNLAAGTYSCLASVHDPYKLLVPVQRLNFEVVSKDTLSLFKVFPNPASGSVTFTYQCTAANQGGVMELSVYNAFGDAVFTGKASHPGAIAGIAKWDLRSDNQPIDPGVYLARLKITVNAANGSAQHILSGTARVVVVR